MIRLFVMKGLKRGLLKVDDNQEAGLGKDGSQKEFIQHRNMIILIAKL